MNYENFNKDYIGKKVLVQTNEQDTDLIPATIIRREYMIPYSIKLLPHIISKCGKAVYFQSGYDGTWWKYFLFIDKPRVFIGINKPKNP